VYHILAEDKQAWEAYQKATAIFKQQGEKLYLAQMRVGVIACLQRLGEYQKAISYAQNAWRILAANEENETKRLASVANNWGIVLDYLGRYEEAIAKYEQKIALWEQIAGETARKIQIARTQINIGVTKKRLNLWAEAELALRQGRQTLHELPKEAQENYIRDIARADIQLADIAAARGDPPDKVAEAFARARRSRTAVSDKSPDLLHLDLLEYQWRLQVNQPPADLTARLYTLREKCQESGQAREGMQASLLLAQNYKQQGDIQAAIDNYVRVRREALAHEDWELVYRAWYGLGRLYLEVRRPKKGVEALETAVSFIENTGRQVASGELRSAFLADKLAVYQTLAYHYIEQEDLENALHWVERARARELVELYGSDPSSLSAFFNHSDSEELWADLMAQRRQRVQQPEASAELEARIADLTRRLIRREPASGMSLSGETSTKGQWRDSLPAQTLFLLYAVLQDRVWVIPATKEQIYSPRPLGPAPAAVDTEHDLNWIRNVGDFTPQLVQRRANNLIASAREPLARWYNLFLSPVSDLLAQAERVIIAPDGPLYRLPFHAFWSSQTGQYLVETHHISYSPGATAWVWGRQQPTPTSQQLLALAYPHHDLQDTVHEVKAIQQSFPEMRAYIEESATRNRLYAPAAQQAAFIHLAAHASFRGDHPLFSYIQLADGRLETSDVLHLQLQARVVALSACETGRGLLRGGEYLGLTRAFLLAGARSVLASYWSVSDTVTPHWMSIFYRTLAETDDPVTAVTQAQRQMIHAPEEHWRHPYFWSAFFLFGSA
jgi:CHAT domain-containing protein